MTPTDWPIIARAIRVDRANNQCECTGECGNYELHGITEDNTGGMDGSGCGNWHKPAEPLTVVTLDNNRENVDPDNLRAMCPGCRLAYTAPLVEAEIAARAGSSAVPLPGLGIEL